MRELAQIIACEQITQFRLSDENYLQQFLFGRLEVGQQSDLLKNSRREILRLVDYENGAPALRVCAKQVLIQRISQRFNTAFVMHHLNMEFFANRRQKLDDR